MKILLTGASGFLGSHIAEQIVRQNHEVFALVRKTSSIEFLKSLPRLHFVEGDLEKIDSWSPVLSQVDAIIHNAGIVKARSESDFLQVNAQGTRNLVQALLRLSPLPRTFLYISSLAVHAASKDSPDFCIPPSQCKPLTAYGRSKLRAELELEPLRGKIRVQILRPPALYGPRDSEMFALFQAAKLGIIPLFKQGENALSLCYAQDAARAALTLVQPGLSTDEIFCLDDGEVYTWKSLGEIVGQAMQKRPIPLRIPPLLYWLAAKASESTARARRHATIFTADKIKEIAHPYWVCGHWKLREKTGWEPQVKLLEGARKTWEFYKKEGWL